MMRAWSGSLLKYRFPLAGDIVEDRDSDDDVILPPPAVVYCWVLSRLLVSSPSAQVLIVVPSVVPDVIEFGGINVPTLLLIVARIINDDTAKVPTREEVDRLDFIFDRIDLGYLPTLRCRDEPRKA